MRSEAEQRQISLNQEHPMLNWNIIGTDTVSLRREFVRAIYQKKNQEVLLPLYIQTKSRGSLAGVSMTSSSSNRDRRGICKHESTHEKWDGDLGPWPSSSRPDRPKGYISTTVLVPLAP
jgi:hypothetical protein